jgi:hypothetical protein
MGTPTIERTSAGLLQGIAVGLSAVAVTLLIFTLPSLNDAPSAPDAGRGLVVGIENHGAVRYISELDGWLIFSGFAGLALALLLVVISQLVGPKRS